MGVIIFIVLGVVICGLCATNSEQAAKELAEQQIIDEAKLKEIRRVEKENKSLEERKKAYRELCYDRKKEGEFWRYFYLRKKGKLTYIVPEFEERIVKMNKLKKENE